MSTKNDATRNTNRSMLTIGRKSKPTRLQFWASKRDRQRLEYIKTFYGVNILQQEDRGEPSFTLVVRRALALLEEHLEGLLNHHEKMDDQQHEQQQREALALYRHINL
ncbi:hypothetical protein [Oceanidesulfovibrio marinus]|nr:hypothetical protein [Oceanidesulfovibrio marinus]